MLGTVSSFMQNSANGARLLVRGLVKRPGKARPNRLSNSTLNFTKPPEAVSHKGRCVDVSQDNGGARGIIPAYKSGQPFNLVAHIKVNSMERCTSLLH